MITTYLIPGSDSAVGEGGRGVAVGRLIGVGTDGVEVGTSVTVGATIEVGSKVNDDSVIKEGVAVGAPSNG
jgi:hypothetical protein